MATERPTASTITDDQLDALWKALDEVEKRHSRVEFGNYDSGEPYRACPHCGWLSPCPTLQIIARQRRIVESYRDRTPDPEEADHLA